MMQMPTLSKPNKKPPKPKKKACHIRTFTHRPSYWLRKGGSVGVVDPKESPAMQIHKGAWTIAQHIAGWWQQNLKIINKKSEMIPLVANKQQLDLLYYAARCIYQHKSVRIIVLKARRMGISTAIQALQFYTAWHQKYTKGLTAAHKTDATATMWNMAQLFKDEHPDKDKQPLARSNTKELVFAAPQRSTMRFLTGGVGDLARSEEVHFLHLSEVAYMPDAKTTVASVMKSVSKNPNTFAFKESTANGASGQFYEDWNAAVVALDRAGRDVDKVTWNPLFFSWLDFPEYRLAAPQDYDWGTLDPEEVRLRDELHATPEQLYWRRMTIADDCGGDPENFHQEYPACVTAETRVSTDKGIIPISEAQGATSTESGPVVAWGPQPKSAIYKLTTRRGRVLRGTADHPVAVGLGSFTKLADLSVGQSICLRVPRFASEQYIARWHPVPGVEHRIEITGDWGAFVGMFMGDGSWHKSTISVVCDAKDQDVVDQASAIVTRLFAAPKVRQISRLQGRKGATELRLGCMPARDAMMALGLIRQTDGRSSYRREVHVPDCIWRSPRPIVREFLRWLYECDGSASGFIVRFATCKEQFARDIQLLLLGFGINSSLHYGTKKSGNGQPYQIWSVNCTKEASILFHEVIGFVGQRKTSLRPGLFCGRGRPRQSNDMVDEVCAVVPDGEDITYDFTIGVEHVFSANGILTHNTPEESFLHSGRRAIPANILAHHRKQQVEPISVVELYRNANGDVKSRLARSDTPWKWLIFEPVMGGIDYAVGGDVMENILADKQDGASESDRHAGICLNRDTLKIVAGGVGRILTDDFGKQLLMLAEWYNMAWGSPEVNSAGLVALREWRDYPRLYQRPLAMDTDQTTNHPRLGWRTTMANRNFMVDSWLAHCRMHPTDGWNGQIEVPWADLVDEEQTFVIKPSGKREHDAGAKDDILFAAMIALQVHLDSPREKKLVGAVRQIHSQRADDVCLGDYPEYAFAGGVDYELVVEPESRTRDWA